MEPVALTMAGVGSVALSEGVKFMYAEAGELLKRWLDRKRDAASDDAIKVDLILPEAFKAQSKAVDIHPGELAVSESELASAYERLSLYASGVQKIDSSDIDAVERAEDLRIILERILGVPLTLKGEIRLDSTMPVVRGSISAKSVSGEASAVRANRVRSGTIVRECRCRTCVGRRRTIRRSR